MKFALAVHGAPYSSQSAATALRFARAALAAGHTIPRVFFYHDGVHSACALAVPPQDEPSPQAGWVALAEQHGIELAVCIAASLKRGVVDAGEQHRYDLPASNVHPAFTVVGLGQLLEAIMSSDRFVTFAA
ncbi:MAG TPA: sulfurtransferase complex subunit TusD [Pseudomonadales bacterium]